jgi:hypothetical protein
VWWQRRTRVDAGRVCSADHVRRSDGAHPRGAVERIPASLIRKVQRSIQRSWNRCADGDVCVDGQKAVSTICAQPDQARPALDCLVIISSHDTAADGTYSGASGGYRVRVQIAEGGSFTTRRG